MSDTWGFPYTQNPISDNEPANAPRWWTRFLSPLNAALASVGDSGWLPLAYSGAWTDYNAATYEPGQYRLLNGQVWLQGLIKAGAVGTIATLPAGYRPDGPEIFACTCDGPSVSQTGGCRINVAANGIINLSFYFSSGDNQFVSLTGIHFDQAN